MANSVGDNRLKGMVVEFGLAEAGSKGGSRGLVEGGGKEREGKESVLVVLAQNLFYNWCLFYTNPSSEISIENY